MHHNTRIIIHAAGLYRIVENFGGGKPWRAKWVC